MVEDVEKLDLENITEISYSKIRYLFFVSFSIVGLLVFKIFEGYIARNFDLVFVLLIVFFIFLIIFAYFYFLLYNYLNSSPKGCRVCRDRLEKIGRAEGYNIFKCSNGHFAKMKIVTPPNLFHGPIQGSKSSRQFLKWLQRKRRKD